MNFSELLKQTGGLCQFSPDGKHLANAVQYRLIIRDVKTLQILHLFTCLDAIQHIEWSPDSDFILCAMFKRGLVQVWSLEEPEWTCKIDEGSAGLSYVRWSPDARHILTTAEFNLRITVWSLIDKSVSYIKHPKSCQKGLDFSGDGKFLALAERRDGKDYISIFSCNNWQLVKHFETDTEDLAGVEWSPDVRVLSVWESCLQYKVLLYSLDGRCLASFSAYDFALGIKTVAWSPTSQFLAIGSYDQKVRVLNHVTWRSVAEHDHPATLSDSKAVVYKETSSKLPVTADTETFLPPPALSTSTKYEVITDSPTIPSITPDPNKANPKLGVGMLQFSPDSKYFFTRNGAEWDPCQPRLAMCTGNNKVYMWSPSGCLSVQVPSEGNENDNDSSAAK